MLDKRNSKSKFIRPCRRISSRINFMIRSRDRRSAKDNSLLGLKANKEKREQIMKQSCHHLDLQRVTLDNQKKASMDKPNCF